MAEDVKRGYYDADLARDTYGVIIDAESRDGDEGATATLRENAHELCALPELDKHASC